MHLYGHTHSRHRPTHITHPHTHTCVLICIYESKWIKNKWDFKLMRSTLESPSPVWSHLRLYSKTLILIFLRRIIFYLSTLKVLCCFRFYHYLLLKRFTSSKWSCLLSTLIELCRSFVLQFCTSYNDSCYFWNFDALAFVTVIKIIIVNYILLVFYKSVMKRKKHLCIFRLLEMFIKFF